MLNRLIAYVRAHKRISLAAAGAVAIVGFLVLRSGSGDEAQTRYVLSAVEKGTLVTSVVGSGQVSVSSQVEVKAEASGTVYAVNVKNGQSVKTGQVIAQIDATDALKAVRDAETDLETARLNFEKLKSPPDALSLLQSKNSLASAREAKIKAENDLVTSYEDGYNQIADAFLDLPGAMSALNEVLYGTKLSGSQWNIDTYTDAVKEIDMAALTYRDDADEAYQVARTRYDAAFAAYKASSRFSDEDEIGTLLKQTYDAARDASQAVKAATDLIRFYQDKLSGQNLTPATLSNTHLSTLASQTGTLNGMLSGLLSAQRSIQSAKDSIVSSARSIAEREASLAELEAGADALDIRSQELTIRQRQEALTAARTALADYSVRAPFDGVIAEVAIRKGETVGNGTVAATIITTQQIAETSLNEVDIAKVKVGQKATMTFDVVEDLTISGTVIEIDALGSVSQGVVNYGVKIGFDTQDDRIKPGMSVSAAIVVDAKVGVLLVPASAVKTSGTGSYVEILDGVETTDVAGVVSETAPRHQIVVVGASNDTQTEIVSGLNEGDLIVTRTVSGSSAASPSSNQSIFQAAGAGAGGGARGVTGGGGFQGR